MQQYKHELLHTGVGGREGEEDGERGVSGKGREKGEWKKGRNVFNSFTGRCMPVASPILTQPSD